MRRRSSTCRRTGSPSRTCADVLWRDPSGHRHPARPAAHRDGRDGHARATSTRSCRCCAASTTSIVIDMSSAVSDINLAFLDASDTIIEIVTYDSTTIHNTIAMADTFRSIGYPASKVQYLVNRADSAGGIEADDLHRALGRVPEHRVVSDGQLVVRSNNEGVPFVLADPSAPVSQDIGPDRRRRCSVRASPGRGRPALAGRVRPTTDRRLRLGGRRADGPPGDRPAAAPRIDDLPGRQRPRAVRPADRRRGPALLDRGPRRARGARRQGARRGLQHLDRGRHRRVPPPLRPAGPRASSGRVPRRPRCRPATGGSASSPRRRRSARTPTSTRSRTRTRPSRSTSTRRRPSCRWSRPGILAGPEAEATVAAALAPLARRAGRGRRIDLPAATGRVDRHAPAGLHALPAHPAAHRGRGRGSHRHRRLRDGDRVRPGRAARRQRARGAGHDPRHGRRCRHGRARATRRGARAGRSTAGHDRRPGALPRPRRAAVRAGPAGRRDGRARDARRDDRPASPGDARASGGSGGSGSSWRDDRAWQAGILIGSALGAAATVVGRRMERQAREGLVDWPAVERIAIGRLAGRPGCADRGRAAGDASPPTPRRWIASCRSCRRPSGRSCPASSSAPGVVDRAGWVRANTDGLRLAHRQARGGPARPGRARRWRPGQGDDGPGQPLDHDPPARVPARVHGPARPRPVRPRAAVGRGDAGPAAVRRGEHPADGHERWASRSSRSGRGSRCTRRPTPSSSRRTPGCGRTSPRAWSAR